jgi:D-alanyl-D-alanine carboxypeptidase
LTTTPVLIRPARRAELDRLAGLIRNRLPDLMKAQPATQRETIEKSLLKLLPDGALLIAIENRQLMGMAALDLDRSRLMAVYLDPKAARADATRQLVRALEQHARSFGIRKLECTVKPQAWSFMEKLGYQATVSAGDGEPVTLARDLTQDAEDWERSLDELHRELGIPDNYGIRYRLQKVRENNNRVSIGLDIFDRDTQLDPAAAEAWKAMKTDAHRSNIELQVVSGFRSIGYQAGLIRKKLDQKITMGRILRVSAAPGYSEHHSGCALDLTVPGVAPLTSEFSMSRAYEWLKARAGMYGFHQSFPENNRHNIDWEPWHWCYHRSVDPRAR